MNNFNDIGITKELLWPRIKKLLTIGLFASVLHLIGDFILGCGTENEALSGIERMISAYTSASDGGILAAAVLGLLGMALEGLCLFGVYRLIAPGSQKLAHSFRSGIFGYMMFGPCGFHVPICAFVFLTKHGLADELLSQYSAYFLMPALALFWIFFIVLQTAQIRAFAKGHTPYPKRCWIFSMPVGMVLAMLVGAFGNYPFTNAVSCAWIAIGSLWMFGGLLLTAKKAEKLTNR